jgi:hypothetical protein
MDLDVHNMNRYQARIAINSCLRRATASDYRLKIIHGWQNGDSLMKMIASEYAVHPRVLRIFHGDNPGQTELVLREY